MGPTSVFGVKATDKTGKEKYFKAKKGVLLACGGYENNPQLIDSHILPGVRVRPAGTPYNLGDGVYMAQEAGADIVHMAGCEWMGFGANPPGHDVAIKVELRKLGKGIVVNRFGKRYFNEDKKLDHTRTLVAIEFDGYPDDPTALSDYKGVPSFLIFDEAKRLAGPLAKSKLEPVTDMAPPVMGFLAVKGLYEWSADNSQEIENGMIKKADSIQELAEIAGIDPVALEETIKNWNDYCQAGEDAEFGRPPNTMGPIEGPPYYAMEIGPLFINTQGGPKHSNLDGKVLDRYDNPIPRLYAAGECGSVYSCMYHGSGNIAEALIVGKLAAETALQEEPWA